MIYRISSATSLRHFRSAPLAHWVVLGWQPFKAVHRTSISQQGYHVWGRFTSYRITTFSLTCWRRKFTQRSELVAAILLHSLKGQSLGPAALGKDIQYVQGLPAGERGYLPLISPSHTNAMLCLPVGRQ